VPTARAADALVPGTEYLLTVLRDVGLPIASCVFTFGEPVQEPVVMTPAAQAGTSATGVGAAGAASVGDAAGAEAACSPMDFFGAPCTDTVNHSECGCAADYCAQQPGEAEGYCTATDCLQDPSVCPAGWSCFDVSIFAPGSPAVCLRP